MAPGLKINPPLTVITQKYYCGDKGVNQSMCIEIHLNTTLTVNLLMITTIFLFKTKKTKNGANDVLLIFRINVS